MLMSASNNISYGQEILRKLIHLSSLWMPVTIYFLEYKYAVILFSLVFFIVFLSEILRLNSPFFRKIFNYFFGNILREHETNDSAKFAGAFYVCFAVLIALALFPKIIAVTAISIMLISDTASALIGRRLGKTKILSKSLEGLLAFIIFGLFTVSFIYYFTNQHLSFLIAGYIGAIVAGFIELISKDILKIDDNITIVLSCAVVMFLLI